MNIEVFVKVALIVIIVLLVILIGVVIIANIEKKVNKKIKHYEYIDMINQEYEKLIIPTFKKLIVKLGKDTPLNKEEREMLEDIIMESNKNG